MDDQTTPRVVKKTKTPMHTLVRVRNNQRLHRQRRRDYIESLERKLETIEDTTRRLGIENEALRKQLAFQNHPDRMTVQSTTMAVAYTNNCLYPAIMDAGQYQGTWDGAPHTSVIASHNTEQSTALKLQPWSTLPEVQTGLSNSISIEEKSTDLIAPSMLGNLFVDFTRLSRDVIQSPAMHSPSACCSETSSEALDGHHKSTSWPDNRTPHPWTSSDMITSSTTLCSQAYLVIQHRNRRGLSSEMIESWLWPGFIYVDGTAESACRVDSRLLLGLLAYVTEAPNVGT